MKPKLIIVEAPQGGGKTTVTNLLRDKMPYTNLFRLTGLNDTSKEAESIVADLRISELNLISETRYSGINYILDRCHVTEKVYANLGYKDYDFKEYSESLNKELNMLGHYYDVHFILLTNSNEVFEKRLRRNKPTYADVQFSVDNSSKQLTEYLKELEVLKKSCPNVNFNTLNTDYLKPQEVVDVILYTIK